MTTPSSSFLIRQPPTFDTVAEERNHRLTHLVGACRIFAQMGFAEGLLGHLTVRDPEHEDRLWVNPMGMSMRRVRVEDLVEVDHEGRVVSGDRPVNPVGVLLHTAVHRARPDVVAVCHAHSLYGSAWSSLGRVLDPITQDACLFFERQALITEPRVALDAEAADRFAEAFGQNLVAFQAGHGIFTTGHTIDEAAWWFIAMEKSCHAALLAEAAGSPQLWPAPAARALAAGLGSPGFGWLSFQALWDELSATDLDLFQQRA